MRIKIDDIAYYVGYRGQGRPLIMLHGFSESQGTWDSINLPNYRMYGIDFIGHGLSDRPDNPKVYEIPIMLDHLHRVIRALAGESYVLMGYSMGARIALLYALQYGQELEALVLESGSPGIQDNRERLERKEKDFCLGQAIEKHGLVWFEETWKNLPVFETQASLPQKVQREIQKRRLQNTAYALAHTFAGSGQGTMPYVGNQLDRIQCPSLYIAGALDTKYSTIAKRVFGQANSFTSYIIDGAGHNVHLEKPKEFQEVVSHFLENTVK